MKTPSLSIVALACASSAAYAQSAPEAAADAPLPESSTIAPADPAAPAEAASAAYSVEEIDSFAEATIKVQAIDSDTSIAADQKQEKMAAAVAQAGLDAARYNEIGKAAAADPELRTKIQTAMARHAAPQG